MGKTTYLDDVATVRRTAEWVGFRRSLKAEGRASLVFGLVAVLQGAVNLDQTLLAWPVLALGLFLIIAGATAVRKPTPWAMQAELTAWWLVVGLNLLFGLLLLVVGFVGPSEAAGPALVSLVLGAVQSYWAVQATRRYRRFRELARSAPPAEAVTELEALADELAALKSADTPETVEITTTGLADTGRWRARLAQHWALFVDRRGRGLAVATPEELEIQDRGERLVSRAHKATVRFGTRQIAGTMAPDALARLQTWKGHAATPA